MKKSTIITIIAFVLGIAVLTAGFILVTDNNIKDSLFPSTSTTSTTKPQSPEEPAPEPMDFFSVDVSEYVRLGAYTGLVFDIDWIEIDEKAIDEQILMTMFKKGDLQKKEEGTVSEGMIFNFDYKGYINDVPFEGGSATNQTAYISGNDFVLTSGSTFIDGFAQGVLGAEVGVEVNVPVTFPEDYHNSEYAGKDAVFKVKVNYIQTGTFTDELADKYSNGKYKTAAEYRDSVKKDMEDSLAEKLNDEKSNLVWNKIIEGATFHSVPEEQFNYYFNNFKSYVESYQAYLGSYEAALKYFGFEDEDALKEYTNDVVKQELALYAVLQAENIQVTDIEFSAFVGELKESMGVETDEEVFAKYSEETIKEQIILDKTQKFVLENNTFNIIIEGK